MNPLKLGLIGTGYWARTVHGASAVQHPDVQLAGVWGRDKSKTEAAASELATRPYLDLDQLLGDVEALTFAVPPDVQADIALRAANAGKHLLLEKPIATTVGQGRHLERTASEKDVASIVFFTRRFIPEIQQWIQRLQQVGGWECGRAEVAASILTDGNPFGQSPWRHEKGGLWDVGPHALSILLPLLGPVTSVVAGRGVRDQVHLVLQHPQGRSSTMSLSLMVPDKAIGGSTYVYGEHGREEAPVVKVDPVRAHGAALTSLLEQAGRSDKRHPCDVHFGARVVEILSAAEESLSRGCQVSLEEAS